MWRYFLKKWHLYAYWSPFPTCTLILFGICHSVRLLKTTFIRDIRVGMKSLILVLQGDGIKTSPKRWKESLSWSSSTRNETEGKRRGRLVSKKELFVWKNGAILCRTCHAHLWHGLLYEELIGYSDRDHATSNKRGRLLRCLE